jgi:5'-nucleotidase
MRILICNDDGIQAPGLNALEEIAGSLSEDVWIVAPETDSSGASHSLTLAEPLRMRELDERRYAVKGTPTDCVIMGVRFLLRDAPPDLVISGINRGQNLADDVTYSGTVAGAIQGALLGIPSIAMSMVCGSLEEEKGPQPPIWETAMTHGAEVVRNLLKAGWPEGVVINVNYPNCEPHAVRGIAATAQGQRDPGLLRIEDRLDTHGNAYYWVGIERRRIQPPEGTDLWAVRNNFISVTPLCLDYTDRGTLDRLGASLAREEVVAAP